MTISSDLGWLLTIVADVPAFALIDKKEWIVFPWEDAKNSINDKNEYLNKRALN